MESSREIWVATYTADARRDGVGIGAVRFTPPSAEHPVGRAEWLGQAVDAASPSFVAVHPTLPVVYAVAEFEQTVAAYRRVGASGGGQAGAGADAGAGTATGADVEAHAGGGAPPDARPLLEAFGEPWPAGAAVCHVAVDPQGRFVIAACWGDGRVVLYELDDSGAIVSRFEGEPAVDPHADRAAAELDVAQMLTRTGFAARVSRAHCGVVLPDGRIMTTDLGYDLVRVWNYVPGAGLTLDHEVVLPFWMGPRHLIPHPNGAVMLVSEYSVEVVVLATSDSSADAAEHRAAERAAEPTASGLPRFTVAQISPVTERGAQPLDGGSEIGLSDDARFAYVTVRGSNLLATLRVDARGHVSPMADRPSGGNWPRHHLVFGSTVLVAHERSSNVTLFALDPDTGLPTGPTQQLAIAAPTALIPA